MRALKFILIALLLTTGLHADKIPDWKDVPELSATPVDLNIDIIERQTLSKLNEGSELSQSIRDILSDELWQKEDDITDALFKAIGDVSVSFDLIDKSKFSAEVNLSPKRRIFFYNPPMLSQDQDGKRIFYANNNTPSKYVLFDALETKLELDYQIKSDIPGVSGVYANVKADAGVGLYYLSTQNSPRVYPDNLIATSGVTTKEDIVPAEVKEKGFFKNLARVGFKLFNKLEDKIAKVASGVSDEDATPVFFDNLFNPLRLPTKLPVNAKSIKEKMKNGDILTMSLFGGGGPEVAVETGTLESSLEAFMRVAYQISVLRVSDTVVRVRPKFIVKKGLRATPGEIDFKIDIGVARVSGTPFLWAFEGSNSHSLETLLEYDLSTPEAQAAFNDALQFQFDKTSQLIATQPQSARVVYNISEIIKLRKSDFILGIGLVKLLYQKQREVKKTTDLATRDGVPKSTWSGEVHMNSYSRIKSFKKTYEVSKRTRTILRSSKDDSGDEVVNRLNLVEFSNKNTTADKLNTMLSYMAHASGQGNAIIPDSYKASLLNYFRQKESGHFHAFLITRINEAQLKLAFSLDENVFWQEVANLLLEDPSQSVAFAGTEGLNIIDQKKREKILNIGKNVHWSTCKTTSVFRANSPSVSCEWVWITANQLGQTYKSIKNAKSEEKRLQLLTKLEVFFGQSPILNAALISAYLRAGGPRNQLAYLVRIEPPIGSGVPSYVNTPLEELSRDLFRHKYGFGELTFLTESDSFFKNGEVFKYNNKLYLSLETPAFILDDQHVTLWLAEHRVVLKDIPAARSRASQLIPQLLNIDSQESYFRYVLELDDNYMPLVNSKSLELRVRLENDSQAPLSELGRFKLKN